MISSAKRLLLIGIAVIFSGGCTNIITGNNEVDAANFAAAALLESKGSRQKQSQKDFEQDLEKKMRSIK